eukprot:gene25651-30981_t
MFSKEKFCDSFVLRDGQHESDVERRSMQAVETFLEGENGHTGSLINRRGSFTVTANQLSILESIHRSVSGKMAMIQHILNVILPSSRRCWMVQLILVECFLVHYFERKLEYPFSVCLAEICLVLGIKSDDYISLWLKDRAMREDLPCFLYMLSTFNHIASKHPASARSDDTSYTATRAFQSLRKSSYLINVVASRKRVTANYVLDSLLPAIQKRPFTFDNWLVIKQLLLNFTPLSNMRSIIYLMWNPLSKLPAPGAFLTMDNARNICHAAWDKDEMAAKLNDILEAAFAEERSIIMRRIESKQQAPVAALDLTVSQKGEAVRAVRQEAVDAAPKKAEESNLPERVQIIPSPAPGNSEKSFANISTLPRPMDMDEMTDKLLDCLGQLVETASAAQEKAGEDWHEMKSILESALQSKKRGFSEDLLGPIPNKVARIENESAVCPPAT